MRLASVGRMALNIGSWNPQRCTISLFLEVRGTRLSETSRSTALYFCSLRVSQPASFILLFRTFKTHSPYNWQIFVTLWNDSITLLRVGRLQNLQSVIIRLHSLHRLPTNRRWGEVFQPGICEYEISHRRSYFVSDLRGGRRRFHV